MKPSIRVGENLYIDLSRKNEICLFYKYALKDTINLFLEDHAIHFRL